MDADGRGLAGADGEADADREAADVVGVDLVGVLQARAAEAGGAALVVLDAGFHHQAGAGDGDQVLGLGDLVQQDRVRRADDPRRDLGAAHALDDLRARGSPRPRNPLRALDHVDQAGAGLRDRAELVDDQQHALVARLALHGVLGEVLDQEAREPGSLVLEPQAVEEQVAGGGVFERPAGVEAFADGAEERRVARADLGDLAGGVGDDLRPLRPAKVRVLQPRQEEAVEQLARAPWRALGG